jgi:hypothetical protein
MHSVFQKHSKETFSQRFFRNLRADLFIVWNIFAFAYMMLMGLIIWVLSFPLMNTIVGRFIVQPLLIYIIGTYFTNLPHWLVILMAVFPLRLGWPILFIAFIIMFIF